ncbi:MAG: flagellar hook-length control protein FliK [Deltaproteobacteria bacterium]|nr:flagellar hook-length control protein FliK [Deltaproteobacteria bacterium]
METLIPSTPSPAGFAAPASGLGSQAAPPDASGSASGSFLQIFMNSCVAQATGNGEPADAPAEGQGEDAAKNDAASGSEDTVAAESMMSAALFVAGPPAAPQTALPAEEGTASPEAPSSGSSASLAAAVTAGAEKAADTGAEPPAASEPARGAVTPFPNVPAAADPAKAAPAAEQAAVSAFDVPAAEQAADAASGIRPAVKTAEPVATAADPVSVAAKDVPAARPEGFPVEAKGDPSQGRIDPTADASRKVEAPAAPVASEGKPSLASKEGDSEAFSSALTKESARADKAAEGMRAESAFRVQEAPNPNASPAVAAGRNAAENVSAPRPPLSEPGAAQAQRTFQVGENAFVLNRKSDTSMEITLSPPGVGKLEIEIVLDKGVVNANITAADPAGRDAIQRSLPQIVQALADGGMAIGGFTVSLKQQGNEQDGNAQPGKAAGSDSLGTVAAPEAARSAAKTGLVDIFV